MPRRLAVAAHPVAVAALVVLVVNDHVLKGWSGGVDGLVGTVVRSATGKASDLAGVLVLAIWLGALTGRRRPAVVAVALGFTALKLSPVVADLAVPLLGGRTRTDPWDLLALVALVPADRVLRPLDGRAPLDLRPAWAALRPTLGLAVVVASVPAMTATSKCPDPTTVAMVAVDDDSVIAGVGDRTGAWSAARRGEDVGLAWYRSRDGVHWVAGHVDQATARRVLVDDDVSEACTGDLCYRVRREQVDERRDGGRWERSFSHRGRLPARGPTLMSCPEEDTITFGAVAARDDVVVVANGTQGVVTRRGEGDWERAPVGGLRPDDLLPTPSWPNVGRGAFALGALGVLLLLLTATRGPRGTPGGGPPWPGWGSSSWWRGPSAGCGCSRWAWSSTGWGRSWSPSSSAWPP